MLNKIINWFKSLKEAFMLGWNSYPLYKDDIIDMSKVDFNPMEIDECCKSAKTVSEEQRRWKVELPYGGYISLAYEQEALAREIYKEQNGIRLLLCENIFDEGIVIDGVPLYVDLTGNKNELPN